RCMTVKRLLQSVPCVWAGLPYSPSPAYRLPRISAHPVDATVVRRPAKQESNFSERNDMRIACAAFALLLAAFPALAQNVKITPIGSHPGELCANDRALIFEDPTGVRFLYDAAQNVTGGDDPRLGAIHLVLLSHMHGDHVGDLKLKAPGEGTCANSARVPAP